jgi:stage IV sporulation protein B
VPIALKQEIELGPATILCTLEEEVESFEVEITKVRLEGGHVNRGIELRVTDPELLRRTGGIVQGMSGSPILQNGKLIGAVTHVLVKTPDKGYGIFIENMLEENAKSVGGG